MCSACPCLRKAWVTKISRVNVTLLSSGLAVGHTRSRHPSLLRQTNELLGVGFVQGRDSPSFESGTVDERVTQVTMTGECARRGQRA